MFRCEECGRKFVTFRAAFRAGVGGCPKCGSLDIQETAPLVEPPTLCRCCSKPVEGCGDWCEECVQMRCNVLNATEGGK